jgi:demethylmenaquinone methyltransferase/2-methoxy-6-polyprenyl-1,4-benzoquinol methylase
MNEYKFAPVYDLILSPYITKVRRKVLNISQEYKFRSILDVCCGTGNQVKLLCKNGFDATGVDLNEDMLRQSGKGFITPPCKKQDAANMDIADNSFDMSTTTLSLHETEPGIAKKIVKEMVRVTKPGGYLILIDYEISGRTSRFSHRLVTLVESLVGGDHYRNFKKYIQNGGLSNIISEQHLQLDKEVIFRNHGLVLMVLQVS